MTQPQPRVRKHQRMNLTSFPGHKWMFISQELQEDHMKHIFQKLAIKIIYYLTSETGPKWPLQIKQSNNLLYLYTKIWAISYMLDRCCFERQFHRKFKIAFVTCTVTVDLVGQGRLTIILSISSIIILLLFYYYFYFNRLLKSAIQKNYRA